MKLFLTSEAKNPVTIKNLEEYIKGFPGKSIAYIPTAANGEGWGSWKDGESWKLVQSLGAEVTLVQLEEYRTKEVSSLLRGKDLIWFAGGTPGYLTYWIRRTELDKQLPEILQNGSLYVGSSAGSMVTGQNSKVWEWYIGETEPGASLITPLGLVNFDIYPHYQDESYEQIKAKYDGNQLYLLKDGEAILVENDEVTVFGEKRLLER